MSLAALRAARVPAALLVRASPRAGAAGPAAFGAGLRPARPRAGATARPRALATRARAAPRDHYAALGVSRGASAAELKKAYYTLAKRHHPDAAGGAGSDAEAFAEVNAAYEVLSDPEKRRVYDQYGAEGVAAAAAGGAPGGGGGFGGGGGPSPEDILRDFGAFFGGGGGGMGGMGVRPRRAAVDDPEAGEDKQTSVTLEFMEAAKGVERRIRVGALQTCTDCSGTGKTRKTSIVTCGDCNGSGHVRSSPAGGIFGTVLMPCRACRGAGDVMRDPCGGCAGLGVARGVKESRVAFPAGADSGMIMRVPGAGDAGVRGGPPGDLYVQVRVKEDDYFHRDGKDLHVVAPISVAQAALGGHVEVRTVDGTEEVAVRPGTQSDETTTLRGRALRSVNRARRGDQLVHFKVVVPSSLSERQRKLFEELAGLDGGQIARPEECGIPGLVQKFQRFLKTSIGTGGGR